MNLNQFAWNCFYQSGNIEAFLLYKQEETLIRSKESTDRKQEYGIGENRRNCPSGNQIR